MLEVVLQLNKELTIVFFQQIELLLKGRCPKWRFIGPVTLPLARAPGIAELEKPYAFTLVLDLMNRDERVSVA